VINCLLVQQKQLLLVFVKRGSSDFFLKIEVDSIQGGRRLQYKLDAKGTLTSSGYGTGDILYSFPNESIKEGQENNKGRTGKLSQYPDITEQCWP